MEERSYRGTSFINYNAVDVLERHIIRNKKQYGRKNRKNYIRGQYAELTTLILNPLSTSCLFIGEDTFYIFEDRRYYGILI